MYFLNTARALLAVTVFQAVAAHNIVLPAHGRECFHENLHKDDTMTVTFQVGDREFGSAGNLDIDFWVRVRSSAPSSPPAMGGWFKARGSSYLGNNTMLI